MTLTSELLFRALLVRIASHDHVLFLTSHHIAADGWSITIVFKELAALDEAFSRGGNSPLGELSLQYRDFAIWQRSQFASSVEREMKVYWTQRLGGAPPALEIPADRTRPRVLSSAGARHYFGVNRCLVEQARTLSRQEGATLYMILLAVFKTLLFLYTGQTDIVVGTPYAGRDLPELEPMIGCFSNTLVLRTKLSGDVTFRQLLTRVRETALGAFAHHVMPFEKVVEALRPKRDPGRMVLVQHNFRVVNAPLPPTQIADLRAEFLAIDNKGSKFDVAMELYDRPDGLGGFLEYSTQLFDASTMRLLAEDYEHILGAAAAFPDTPVRHLNALLALPDKPIAFRSARSAPRAISSSKRRSVRIVATQYIDSHKSAAKPATVEFSLRRANVRDSAFIYDLRARTMREHIERFGWTEAQRQAFLMDFNPDDHEIVIVGSKPVGAVSTFENATELHLQNLHLLPEFQGRALGAHNTGAKDCCGLSIRPHRSGEGLQDQSRVLENV